LKQKLKDIEPYGHNFEVSFKKYADKKDPLYVNKINDKRWKPVHAILCLQDKHKENEKWGPFSEQRIFFWMEKANGAMGLSR